MRSRWQSLTCRSINKYQEFREREKRSQSYSQTFTHTFVVSPFFRFFRSQQSLHNPLYGYQSLQWWVGGKTSLPLFVWYTQSLCLTQNIAFYLANSYRYMENLVSKFFSNKNVSKRSSNKLIWFWFIVPHYSAFFFSKLGLPETLPYIFWWIQQCSERQRIK